MAGFAQRQDVIGHVARRIPLRRGGACLRVAVDGPDGSGKTTFADELAAAVRTLGRPVVRVSLNRDEIGSVWDLSVFLEVPFDVTAKRMAHRDGTNPDPGHPGMRRYVEAQRIYFASCSPQQRADILIDNEEFEAPRIVRTTN